MRVKGIDKLPGTAPHCISPHRATMISMNACKDGRLPCVIVQRSTGSATGNNRHSNSSTPCSPVTTLRRSATYAWDIESWTKSSAWGRVYEFPPIVWTVQKAALSPLYIHKEFDQCLLNLLACAPNC